MKKAVIIVAGGTGTRMNADIPKQFMLLDDKPVLIHTIQRFRIYDSDMKIILVLPENHIEYWRELQTRYDFSVKHELVAGGKTRFHSVKNGLKHAADSDLVAIHDGVRPLVEMAVIHRCFETAANSDNAVPVVNVVESLRKVDNDESKAVSRENYRIVQTPQVFSYRQISNAYQQPYRHEFTDDATVVEGMRVKINLVDGNRENIKITTPGDLVLAHALLNVVDKK